MKDGVLFINKPKDWTSRDVVNKVAKIYQQKKVGHTGTLDPLATGVLILCLGKYTKLVDELSANWKTYQATMILGIETDTLDITGKILKQESVNITEKQIEETFKHFPKSYLQEVPIYSAVKVNGKKLYQYAREQKEVILPKKEVQIEDLKIIKIDFPKVTFEVKVSKGTYIRSLIRDLAAKWNTIATMSDLIRIKQGSISLNECLSISDVTSNTPLKTIQDLFCYPTYEVTEKEQIKIQNGNSLHLNSNESYLILTYQKKSIAIYQKQKQEYIVKFKVV